MTEDLTAEQQADVEERTQKFLEGYEALVEEFQVDLAQIPQFVPTSRGLFSLAIIAQPMDKKYLSIPSNLKDLQ